MVSPVSITNVFNGDISAANLVNAAALDTQLTNLAATVNAEIAERQRTIRDGSGLASQVVRFPALHPEITSLLVAGGARPLQAVAAVSIVNVAALSGLLVVDGYTLLATDRVLLTGQTNPVQNGIWLAAAGAWTRPLDSVTGVTLPLYSETGVANGTTQSGSIWLLNPAAVVDSASQKWVFFSGNATVIPVLRGGTGATTAATARAALGLSTLATAGLTVSQSDLNTDVQYRVDTIAALKALTANYSAVLALGYYAAGDGGGGLFRWDSASSLTDNGGTVIIPNSSPANGRWIRQYQSWAGVEAKHFGAKADGVTNDLAAILAAISAVGDGGTVIIRDITRIASTLTITTRTSLWCPTPKDAILVDVGIGNNGIVWNGPGAGLNGLAINLNVYGRANACLNGVVLTRVDRSEVKLNVHAGAVSYGLVLDGCLIDRIYIDISDNYAPPISSPVMPLDAVNIKKNATYAVATNACQIFVNLELMRHGIVGSSMPGEGLNWISGCIEGCTGSPLIFTDWTNPNFSQLWMEANAVQPSFINCLGVRFGHACMLLDVSGLTDTINFINCKAPQIDGSVYANVNYDANTSCGRDLSMIGGSGAASTSTGDGYGGSAESWGPQQSLGANQLAYGGRGMASLENIFSNPLMDIWPNGVAATPAGVSLVNASVAQGTANPFYQANGFTCVVTVTATGGLPGAYCNLAPPYSTWPVERWVSFMIAIWVPSGQPNVRIYGGNGDLISEITLRDQWVIVRGGGRVPPAVNAYTWATCWNAGFVTGTFRIGGCIMVNGPRSPKYLQDSGRRSDYIVDNVGFTPAFQGQRAFVAGTGKWYLAKGAVSSADWIILN